MKQENINRALEIAEEINSIQKDINILQEMIDNNDMFCWNVSNFVKQNETTKATFIYLNTHDIQVLIKDWSEEIDSLKRELETL